MVCISFAATHIALSNEKQKRNGCGFYLYLMKCAVNLYLCRANTRCNQLIAVKCNNSIINRTLSNTVTDFVRGRFARIDDFDVFACNIVAVVILHIYEIRIFFATT